MHRIKLFIPGPTEVREEVLEALSHPVIGHRTQDFSDLVDRVITKLRDLLQTSYRIQVVTASGSGLMEAAVRNFVERKVLVTVIGAFGERWDRIARANGKEVDRLEVPWGQAITPDLLEDALKKDHYEAVLITHNETSTGVMNPLKELAEVVHTLSPDTLILVDAVSSMMGAPIDFEGWGLDYVLAGVQKAFALPPGLAVGVISDRAFEKAKTVSNRGYYFDLVEIQKYLDERRQTPTTPAVNLYYALDRQLDRMIEEGMEARWERHRNMAELVQKWGATYFDLFAERDYRSWTVTTITNTREISVAWLIEELKKRGFLISNGYGQLKEKTFRIGHMGDLTPEDVQELLINIEAILGLNG